jgi:sigma-B regulation protein RsbU (phosphoserine phosphatase)
MVRKKKKEAAPQRSRRHNVQDLLLLQRVAQRINSILDLDTLLEEIVDDVARTFGYTRTGVLLIDHDTNELVIAAVRGWTVNYHVKGDRFRIGEEGMVGHVAATGEICYAPDVRKNPYYMISEESSRSEVDIPLKAHGRVIGVFNAQSTKLNAFPPGRLSLLEALAGHIATAIENARLFGAEREQKNRMAAELEEARRIQTSLFPQRRPEIPGLEVTGLCLPCTEVGGDWYDFIPLGDGRLGLVVGDVSGKGMGAALLMSSSRSIVRHHAENGRSPGELLSRVNATLLRDFPRGKFVTMVYAVLDPSRRTITFSNAGHPWPLGYTTAHEFLPTDTGFPLGMLESTYAERMIQLPPGGYFMIYSDGILEASSPSDGLYGTEHILAHMRSGAATAQTLLDDVRKFSGTAFMSDDATIVMVRG